MALGIKCAYIKCGKYSIQVPDEEFIPFPTDLVMQAKWARNSGILIDSLKNDKLFLCQYHFDADCFIDGSLKLDAMPLPWPDKNKSRKHKTALEILSDYSMHVCKSCGNLYSKKGHECDCNAFKDIFCTGCNLTLSPSKLLKHKCPEALLKKNCVVSRCNSNSKVPTFPIPEVVNLRNAWLERVPISTKYYPLRVKFFVCLKHFKEDDIIRNGTSASIKEEAIPEVFNVPLGQDKGIEKCCLPYCSSNHLNFVSLKKPPVITFPFPTDSQAQRREWRNAIFKQYISPITEGSICIKHFNENQIFKSGEQCFLTHGATPTKFFVNEPKSNQIVSCCVPGCKTVIAPGVVFFPFPRHGSTLVEVINAHTRTKGGNTGEIRDIHELWIERIGISEVTDLTVVCKNHFSGILFGDNKAPYLHELAVPTLNLSKSFEPCLILAQQMIKTKKGVGLADTETIHSGGEEEDLNRPCSVPLCSSHLDKRADRSVHRLPKDLARARHWALIFGCSNWLDQGLRKARENIRICMNHFRPHMLLPNKMLKLGARPFTEVSNKDNCTIDYLIPKGVNIRPKPESKFKKKPNILKSVKPLAKTSQNNVHKNKKRNIPTQKNPGAVIPLANRTIDLTTEKISRRVVSNLPLPVKNINCIEAINPQLLINGSQLILPKNVPCTFLPVNALKIPEPKSNAYVNKIPEPKSNSYVKCAVDSCDNYFDEGRAEFLGQSYFVFPEDPVERQLWLTAINKPSDWNPSRSRICFRHFHEMDVLDGKLLPNAVPTLYMKSKCLAYRPYASNEDILRDDDDVDPLARPKDNLLIISNPFYTPPAKKNSSVFTPRLEIVKTEDTDKFSDTDETYEPMEKKLKKQVKKVTKEAKIKKATKVAKIKKATKEAKIPKKKKEEKNEKKIPKRKVGRPRKKPRIDEIIKTPKDDCDTTIVTEIENFDDSNKEDGINTNIIIKEETDHDFEIGNISPLEMNIKEEPLDMDDCTDSFTDEIRTEAPKNKENNTSKSIFTNESPPVNEITCEESGIIDTFMTYINTEVKKNLEKLPPEKLMPFIVSVVQNMNEFMKTPF